MEPNKQKEEPTTLIEIAEQLRAANQIEQTILDNAGALTPEIEAWLEAITPNAGELMAAKIDGYAFVIDRIEKAAEHWRDESERRARVARTCENFVDGLKDRLKFVMTKLNTTELAGEQSRFKLSPTKKRLVVREPALVPAAYLIEKTTYEIDKSKIADALEAGADIAGCALEGGMALRRYLNNPSTKKVTGK